MLHSLLITSLLCGLCASRNLQLCESGSEYTCTGFCSIDECIKCDGSQAICDTSNPNEVVPRGLSPTTGHLILHYAGPDTELTPDMFDHISDLIEMKITGNIISIAPNTLLRQQNLKWFTVSESKLSSLPDHLFSIPNDLEKLKLPHNEFEQIPTNIFHQTPKLQELNLYYNKIRGCEKATIAPELAKLTHLASLNLARYGHNPELCKNISKDYLLPIQHIKDLDLSESLLFLGDQIILSNLMNLSRLTINKVLPFKECPAKAEELFHNLPPSLRDLVMNYWTSTSRLNLSCVFSDTVLAGLKKLKKLDELDLRYSDRLFGNVLESHIFVGFQSISKLYLNWCGISFTETGVFNAIPNATEIVLEGNSLGPRDLELYTNDTRSNLYKLNLNHAEIYADLYPASSLLLDFPNLEALYMDYNFLKKIPDFGFENNITSVLRSLSLSGNEITRFSRDDGEKLCNVMHSLQVFTAERNKLTDISGFSSCLSITEVMLQDNQVASNLSTNLKALGKLYMVEVIDLSMNQIQYIIPELLANLSKLTILNLADNKIHSLAHSPFTNNPMIKCLDLSGNNLKTFDKSVLSNGRLQINYLYLQSNQITELSRDLLDLFDNQLTKLKYLGLFKNPFKCACDNYLSKWVRQSSLIIQAKNLTCSTPTNPDDITQLATYQPDYIYCNVSMPLIIFSVALADVILSIALALSGYKHRWYRRLAKVAARAVDEKPNEVQDDQCQYDAFISYDTSCGSATQWVVVKLIPAIESISGGKSATRSQLKLYVVDRDATVGIYSHTEKCRAIEASRKVIILLSNSYLANPSCLSEADLVAGYEMMQGKHCYQPNRILVLILEELNEQAIRPPVTPLLRQNVIHIVDDEVKMKRIWRRVRRFIRKPRYMYRKKTKTLTTSQPAVEREQTETVPLIC